MSHKYLKILILWATVCIMALVIPIASRSGEFYWDAQVSVLDETHDIKIYFIDGELNEDAFKYNMLQIPEITQIYSFDIRYHPEIDQTWVEVEGRTDCDWDTLSPKIAAEMGYNKR